jgi:glycerate 2-kinase
MSAVSAVDPTALTHRHLADCPPRSATGRFFIAGAGKAAARMAAGCEAALGVARVSGLVIVAAGCDLPLQSVRVRVAGHPIPDQRSAGAAAELSTALAATADPVICLISGGASSLLVQPRPPVNLGEKIEVNRLLLASGADINEVNSTRKHLSGVKGGGLLRKGWPRPMLTLLLSDVIGDDPSVIGSGPTTPDASTFADARAVLEKYELLDRVAPAVRELLDHGVAGTVQETVKPGDPETANAVSAVIGNNRLALAAAAAEAERLGYEPLVEEAPLSGDTTEAARHWLRRVAGRVDGRRTCALAGGETTVVVRGLGRGGRNQEFALALVEPLAGRSVSLLSAGTDGVDGPTDAAGAFVGGWTLERARTVGLDPSAALAANDSYGFFDRLGDLFRVGPTGTNVMDIKLAVGLSS